MNPAWTRLLPRGLAGRFALASAGLATVALLLLALASWWLVDRQQDYAEDQLAARERQFHAANFGSTLRALNTRMTEVAGSTILATGLVDSAGKETYLGPFLNGIRQVNGIPVQVLFADFEGREIAANALARFTPAQMEWLRGRMAAGVAGAEVLQGPEGAELLALAPLRYARTATPEGAVFYKIALSDMRLDPGLHLAWGPGDAVDSAPVPAPAVFEPLQFRLAGRAEGIAERARLGLPYEAIALLAPLVFAAVFLAGAILARLLTRDLSRLEAFSSAVTTAEASEQRAPETGSREVASLAASINRMLARLREQHLALRGEGEKLAALADALQLADRRKDEFLAMLAHELRNPLAPISTGAELLRKLPGADDRVRRTSDVIGRQVRHMTKLVDDLLDVSRVTRGLVVLDRRPLDLRGCVAAAVDQVRPFVQARAQVLEIDVPEAPLPVVGDGARLIQVLSNLLHNACKFTPEGGRIRVGAEARGAEAWVRVEDNGNGIAPALLPEVFGLFTQGSRQPDRSQGGLGLGLALVMHLVELHGGQVEAASPGPGQGATFTVRLPAGAPLPPPAPEPAAPAPAVQALRIVVVDDNVDAAQSLATLLELEGHQVTVLHDAQAALQQVGAGLPDVFILDIGLPGMDGVELARRLRGLPDAAASVLVALTGYGQASDRARSLEAGFDHHLVKPVAPQELNALLTRVANAAPA